MTSGDIFAVIVIGNGPVSPAARCARFPTTSQIWLDSHEPYGL